MSKTLTNQDYCTAAKEIGCDVSAVKAVAQVESNGGGFLPDGRCKILFERHWFHKFTKGKFDKDHPQISSSNPGGYWGNEKEYLRFNQAIQLDTKAALLSCSWGKFQIMGFNYTLCGFVSVNAFVDAMKSGEAEQLSAFLEFVKHNNLDDEMRRRDWRGFARGYNGSAFAKNQYDVKLASAFSKFEKENINCGELKGLKEDEITLEVPTVSAAEPQIAVQPQQLPDKSNTTEVNVKDGSVSVKTSDNPAPKEKVAVVKEENLNFGEKIWKKVTALFGGTVGIDAISEKAQQVQALGLPSSFWMKLTYIAVGAAVLYLLIEVYRHWSEKKQQAEKTKLLVEQNSTPDNTVQIIDEGKIDDFKSRGYKIITRE